ncbi:TRAP transporter small permease [Ramlibacter sp. AW1]|uniref:TRAP transporter small permease protein n=1 Tax=Ramlibacter aurantiacus TaxID=2801330 RepID=A0A937D4V4_9BURK|nr:TRAP transporter small permease [Ramlibacter aurantiacus]MBL0420697.1 TRAP transporter small permease [Ramlibacter aurantiacus]
MKAIADAYFQLMKLALVTCLAGMVVLVFGNVVLRYAFNSGITMSEEVARLLFLYATFLGAVVAMREHLHIGIDSLVKRLPVLGKKACLVTSHALVLLACGLFFQGSWAQTVINLSVKMPVTGISMGTVYAAGLVFSASAALIVLNDLYRALAGQLSEAELVAVREGADPEVIAAAEHEPQRMPPGAKRQPADRAEVA